MVLRFVVLGLVCALAFCAKDDSSLIVNTEYGAVKGHMNEKGVKEWKGIPFASPPVGDLRWEYPQPPAKFSESVYEANIDVKGCQQVCKLPPGNCPEYGQSEDCLYLTVTAPTEPSKDANGYPVFFWIHGGAFEQGIGTTALYDGSQFSSNEVVTVVINYRLGALGFMASEDMKGNYGVMDQRMAMEWTKNNIKGFGGDPSRVTIAGQSAGAMSVAVHLVAPGSKGLYNQAVMESNCLGMPYHTRNSAASNAKAMADYLKCDSDDVLTCMKSKSAEEILDAQSNSVKMDRKTLFINFLPFAPMVEDNGLIPQQPLYALYNGNMNPVPLLVGSVLDEGVLFVDELFTDKMSKTKYHTTIDVLFGLHKAKHIKKMYPFEIGQQVRPGSKDGRDAFSVLATDLIFFCPLRNVTRGMTNAFGQDTVPIHQYRFTQKLSFDPWGPDYAFCNGVVCHGSELPFIFNVFSAGSFNYETNADEKQLTSDMSAAWANFIKGGDPNSPMKVTMSYPPFQSQTNDLVVLNQPNFKNDVQNLNEEACDMWDSYGYFY